MEQMPEQFNEKIEGEKEHLAPFERTEGNMIERISASQELEKIIKFSDDSLKERNPQDTIMAAKDFLERLGGVDAEKAKELADLIEKAEKEIHKRTISKVGPITKFK